MTRMFAYICLPTCLPAWTATGRLRRPQVHTSPN